jgi:hypothetical protein
MKKLLVLLAVLSLTAFTPAFADSTQGEVEQKGVGSVLFLLNPAVARVQTDYTPEGLVDLVNEYRMRALNGEFLSLGINTGYIEMDVKGEKAKLTFFTSAFGKLEKAMKMKISPEGEEKLLKVKARIPYCQMKELYKSRGEYGFSSGRWKFSKDVERELEKVIDL